MPFTVITEAQELIRAAGGEYRPGDKLKQYWMRVCENLAIYADKWVQPGTIHALWKDGRGGKELIEALKKTASERVKAESKKVKPHDHRFIADLRATVEVLNKDRLFPRHEAAILAGVISLMESISRERSILEEKYRTHSERVALLKNCCQVARAVVREAANEITDEAAE